MYIAKVSDLFNNKTPVLSFSTILIDITNVELFCIIRRKQKKRKAKQNKRPKGKEMNETLFFLPSGKHQRIPKGESKMDNSEKLIA